MNRMEKKWLACLLVLVLALPLGLTAANAATSNEIVIVVPEPAAGVLSLSMHADDTVMPGRMIAYRVIVTNVGPAVSDIAVETRLPAGLTIDESSVVNCTMQSSSTVSATFGAIEADATREYSFRALAAQTLTGGTRLEAESTLTGNASLLTANAETRVVETQLAITKTVDNRYPAITDTIAYTLTVENFGEADATGVQVVDTVPGGLHIGAIGQGGEMADGVIRWTADVPAQGSWTTTYQATIDPSVPVGAQRRNTAAVEIDGAPIDSASALITIGGPTLDLVKRVSDQWPEPGDKLTYTLTVYNQSDLFVENQNLKDQLPAGLKLNLNSVRDGGGAYENGAVNWTFDLQPYETKEFSIVCYVPDDARIGTKYVNRASINALTATATSTVYEGEPILELRKLVNNKTPEPGTTVRYTIRVKNVGDADAFDVDILDIVPYDLVVRESTITDDGWLDDDTNRVHWTIDVPCDETVSLQFRAYVPEYCEDGEQYVNRARIVGGDSARVTITVTDGAVPKTGEIDETDAGVDPDALVIAPANPLTDRPMVKASAVDAEPEGEGILPPEPDQSFAELLARNPDVIGILRAGAAIEEPVLFRDNDYYMYNNIDGAEDTAGAVFMDEHNSIWPQDTNILLYGHNMKNGSMFGTLDQYRALDYLNAHPLITFQTVYDAQPVSYAVVAVLDASMNADNPEYVKIRRPNFDDETDADFAAYMDALRAKSYFTIPVDVTHTDKLITLVTCSYSLDNGRMLVVARRLRDGETADALAAQVMQATAK